ncbi:MULTISPECIES: hypothetical protein [unclassified Rhodococcus (in: high G+C Gram-positive bacteria)]|nr:MULTISPECIES: hypothetical protein [unclassified Rhodococcus (in: high G+C Gram-positive bacteria)]
MQIPPSEVVSGGARRVGVGACSRLCPIAASPVTIRAADEEGMAS